MFAFNRKTSDSHHHSRSHLILSNKNEGGHIFAFRTSCLHISRLIEKKVHQVCAFLLRGKNKPVRLEMNYIGEKSSGF